MIQHLEKTIEPLFLAEVPNWESDDEKCGSRLQRQSPPKTPMFVSSNPKDVILEEIRDQNEDIG